MSVVETALTESGTTFSEIGAIAVSIGPGSFTGVRVGVSAARGFALALNIPAIGVTTLEAIAAETRDTFGARTVMSALDAGRDEINAAIYDGQGMLLEGPSVTSLHEAVGLATAFSPVLAGFGSKQHRKSGARQASKSARRRQQPISPSMRGLPPPGAAAPRSRSRSTSAKPTPSRRRASFCRERARNEDPVLAAACPRLFPRPVGGSRQPGNLGIHNEDFVRPWTDGEFAALLEQDTVFGYAAREIGHGREAPAGFVLARLAAGEGEILTIAVARAHRRQRAWLAVDGRRAARASRPTRRSAVSGSRRNQRRGDRSVPASGFRRGRQASTLFPVGRGRDRRACHAARSSLAK